MDTRYTFMLFSPVFIATDPRLFTLLALSFEGLASFPRVVAVCPASPDDFPLHFPIPRRSLSYLELYTYKSLSKQMTLTIFGTIDLQKTGGGVVIVNQVSEASGAKRLLL